MVEWETHDCKVPCSILGHCYFWLETDWHLNNSMCQTWDHGPVYLLCQIFSKCRINRIDRIEWFFSKCQIGRIDRIDPLDPLDLLDPIDPIDPIDPTLRKFSFDPILTFWSKNNSNGPAWVWTRDLCRMKQTWYPLHYGNFDNKTLIILF